MPIKAPFGWIGGKSKLAKDIIALMPSHDLYVEVFGGALHVLYAKPENSLEVINDIDGDLINLHKAIKYNPQTLSLYLTQLLISRQLFDEIKKGIIKPRNKIERAAFFYFMIVQSFGSKMENFAMHAKNLRKPKNIYRDFSLWSKRLKYTTIENMDFEKLISKYDRAETFFYCDPPYVGTERYYKVVKDKFDHNRLKDVLKSIKGKFLISYNDCNFIRKLYKDFKIQTSKEIRYALGSNVHKEKKTHEIFIMNY